MASPRWDAVVVGGGCAGLSAATALAEAGLEVLVMERRPLLGGRAFSFRDRETGEALDNGQHLFLGCYRETRRYLERIGTLPLLPFLPRFEAEMRGPNGARARLRSAMFPAPWHVACAILGYRALSLRDRLRTLRVAREARTPPADLEGKTVSSWLDDLGQSARSCERLWNPITLATLNAAPDRVPASLLQSVLSEGFLKNREDSRVGLSVVGLTELHGDPSRAYVESRGGEVRVRTTVRSIARGADGSWKFHLVDGGSETARVAVLAVPPPALLRLAEASDPALRAHAGPAARLLPSPILSLHAWFDRDPFGRPFVGLWGQEFHWAFRRRSILRDPGTWHFTFVRSAAGPLFGRNREELWSICERNAGRVEGIPCGITRAVVMRENEATWIPPLGGGGRLPVSTPFPGLFLSGDWTDTGLPATLESAVVSGHRAAETALAWLGRV